MIFYRNIYRTDDVLFGATPSLTHKRAMRTRARIFEAEFIGVEVFTDRNVIIGLFTDAELRRWKEPVL